jgi:phage terminase large subunit-like protein
VVTRARTEDNAAFLAQSFLREVRARYSGTSLGLQELDGILLDAVDGALWTREMFDASHWGRVPELERIVVAVDPPAGDKASSDACGIVVAGVRKDADGQPVVHVLEDASIKGASPLEWARKAVEAAHRWDADRVVAEVNQGGAMVETTLRQVDPLLPIRSVHATKGKVVRAEPVAALYEQGRVLHGPGLGKLEAQLCLMTAGGYEGSGSPDRVDALVWAVTELALQQRAPAVPRFSVIG